MIINGYRCVYDPSNPNSFRSLKHKGWMYEHRQLVEARIGRRLTREEVVHHLDGDKLNNILSNLVVMTRNEHTGLHHRKSRKKCSVCGHDLSSRRYTICSLCRRKEANSKYPDDSEFIKEAMSMSYESVGKKYGVTGKAIVKRLRKLNVDIKQRNSLSGRCRSR